MYCLPSDSFPATACLYAYHIPSLHGGAWAWRCGMPVLCTCKNRCDRRRYVTLHARHYAFYYLPAIAWNVSGFFLGTLYTVPLGCVYITFCVYSAFVCKTYHYLLYHIPFCGCNTPWRTTCLLPGACMLMHFVAFPSWNRPCSLCLLGTFCLPATCTGLLVL
jgi:hypothetical protein